ncbi:hypothetical protein KSP40_PGU005529 [Platanthera guangdongensis]|uniref:RING-type E3 ubiquitin transferase n=1 Tax=Platanthera guangdongensis TaxID=2320717 RepID=A0ABR2LWF2_9ASPA
MGVLVEGRVTRYEVDSLCMSQYGPSFQRLEGRIRVATSLTSTPEVTTLPEFSLPDTYHLVPRPLPFESSDIRYSHLQHDGLISRRDKTMRDIQDYQHIRKNSTSSDVEELGGGKKLKNADFEEESKDYMLRNLEDEDCPVCLEGIMPLHGSGTTSLRPPTADDRSSALLSAVGCGIARAYPPLCSPPVRSSALHRLFGTTSLRPPTADD